MPVCSNPGHCRRLSHPPVAVVRGRPHSEHGLIEVPFVALHDQLVSPADHVDVIGGVELGHDVAAKQVACPPGADAPAGGVWGETSIQC